MCNCYITLQLHLSWKNEDLCSNRSWYTTIYDRFMHTTQKHKHSKCHSVGEWLNELWWIYGMEHCSALKINELLIHLAIWMDLQGNVICKEIISWKV